MISGSLAGRRLLARWPSRRVLQLALVGLALGLLGTSASVDLPTLLCASFLFGLGGGAVSLAQNLIVDQSAPVWLRRRAFSGLHAMYGVASLLAPLIAAGALRLGATWRDCLAGIACIPLLVAAVAQGVPAVAPRAPAGTGAGTGGGGEALGRGPWMVAIAVGCCVVAELLISTRLALLLEREGLAPDAAKQHLSGFFACLLASRLVVTFVPIPLSNRRLLIVCAGASLLVFAAGLAAAPRLLPLTALALAPMFPVATDLLAEEYGDRLEAALSALVATCSAFLVLANVVMAVASEEVGLRAALAIGPAALVVTLVMLALSGRGGEAVGAQK